MIVEKIQKSYKDLTTEEKKTCIVLSQDMFEHFKNFCDSNNIDQQYRLSPQKFTEDLQKIHGLTKLRLKSGDFRDKYVFLVRLKKENDDCDCEILNEHIFQ